MSNAPATASDPVAKPDRIAALRSVLPADLVSQPAARHSRRHHGRRDREPGRTPPLAGARRSPRAPRHRRRRGRVDRHRLQHGDRVHRPADRLPRRAAGRAARPAGRLRRIRNRLRVPAVRPQLQPVDRPAGDCRSQLRDLLPADHQLRASERSAQVPGADPWRVCDMYRGRPELCAIALRLLSGPLVVGVDVLDVRTGGADHGRLRLLRHSGVPAAGAIGTETELRRIPVFQRRHRAAVRRDRPGTAARLVAVGRVHGTLRVGNVSAAVRDRPPDARAKPAGRSAVSAPMEHHRPGCRRCSRSGSCCWPRPWSYRSRCRSEVSTPRSSVLPCCGPRWRRCSWRCSRRTC